MQHDVFEDHDRIVNHQAHRRGKSPERHQVETLPGHPQNDEGQRKRDWNDECRDERGPPVLQKEHQDGRGKNDAEQHRVSHAGDGFLHDRRLIVKNFQMHARRQRRLQLGDFFVNQLRDVQRVAVGLAVHAQQNRRLSVCRDRRIDGSFGRADFSDVTDADGNPSGGIFDDDLRNLFGRSHLAADQAKHQLVFVLQQAGRIDQVGFPNGVQNIGNSDPRGVQPSGIRSDLELRHTAALDENKRHAVEPVDARLQIVGGDFPELALGNGVGS